jgi:energy-coupling factor transporter ATP-binding protein EcfA2
MKFRINKIKIWFKNNSEPRILEFKNNKVNVITGASGTGKTSILAIIDYCLLSTNARIAETAINENVIWYGIDFNINNKNFSIARKHPLGGNGSKEVFFSGTGIVPDFPIQNNDIVQVKKILEREFGIDENFKMPYGGKHIISGSKISYRYFLLFNTLSEDTIANTNVFFDFDLYDRDKYVEALDRIFYLAIGVDDVGNVLIKEKINSLEKELSKIEKRKKLLDKEELLFGKKIQELLLQAQSYDLIEIKLFTNEDALKKLNRLVSSLGRDIEYSNNSMQIDELNSKKRGLFRKLRNLERFENEYKQYRESLKKDYDSLKPIQYITENFDQLIPTLELSAFLSSLEESLHKIKNEISNRVTMVTNIKSEVKELKKQIDFIDGELSKYASKNIDFGKEIHKYVFIGEVKSQLNFYENKWDMEEESVNTDEIEYDLNSLKEKIKDTEEKRRILLSDLESIIQNYYNNSNSMGVYKNYKVNFDVRSKTLKVRKETEPISLTIGSKSNYMFLHLFLFLGLHEHFINQGINFVPQFLIIDQPSQPYYESKSSESIKLDDDKQKLQNAFKLLNDFITNISENYLEDFQIILLEHASRDYWEENQLSNFHLVEEFRDGNALIPNEAFI